MSKNIDELKGKKIEITFGDIGLAFLKLQQDDDDIRELLEEHPLFSVAVLLLCGQIELYLFSGAEEKQEGKGKWDSLKF